MAGFGLLGHVATWDTTVTLPQLTGISISSTSQTVEQQVHDSASSLTMAGQTTTTVTFNGVLPKTGTAALLTALAPGTLGPLTIAFKDGIGGSSLVTATSADSNCQSGGPTVNSNANQFTTYSVTITTNGLSYA